MARSSAALPCLRPWTPATSRRATSTAFDRDAPEGGEGQAAANRGAGRVEVSERGLDTSRRGAACCAPTLSEGPEVEPPPGSSGPPSRQLRAPRAAAPP